MMTGATLACVLVVGALYAGAQAAPRLLAHRGGSLEADENTMGAFRQSYEKGLRGFETDVHLTRDEQLVILHDDTLDRTTTGKGSVEAATAEEVRAVRTKKAGEPVPFLSDFLTYFKDKPGVFIEMEMKTNTKTYSDERLEVYCRKLHDEVKRVLPDKAYSFTSFDRRALKIMHRIDPMIATTLIISGPAEMKLIQEAKELGCSRISPQMDMTTRQFVREAKTAGLEVAVWPGTSEQDLALAEALGTDCLTTDIPARLQAKLAGDKP